MFWSKYWSYHALTGRKTENISRTKAYIEKPKAARQSTNKILWVCEIWSKLVEKLALVWTEIGLFLSKFWGCTMHSAVLKIRISQKLSYISENAQRHVNLPMKHYQCMKFG